MADWVIVGIVDAHSPRLKNEVIDLCVLTRDAIEPQNIFGDRCAGVVVDIGVLRPDSRVAGRVVRHVARNVGSAAVLVAVRGGASVIPSDIPSSHAHKIATRVLKGHL